MFRRFLAFAAILMFWAADASAGRILQTNCRMDGCSWADITTTSFVKGGNDVDQGYLMEVEMRFGFSTHKDGNYPDTYSPAILIEWDDAPRSYFVHCSKARPALFKKDDDTITVLGVVDPFGYETDSVNLYGHICHGIEWAAGNNALAGLGYPSNARPEFRTIDALMQRQVVRSVEKSIRTSCWLFDENVAVTNVQNFVNIRRDVGFNAPVLYQARIGERLTAETNNVHYFGSEEQYRRCDGVCEYLKTQPEYQATGYERTVLNQCFEDNVMWYQVTVANGRTGFVSGRYLTSIVTTIAAASASVPPQFRGAWLRRGGELTCAQARAMGEFPFTLIGETSVDGHESGCDLSQITISENGFTAHAQCSGEGESWDEPFEFNRSDYIYCGPK